MDEESYCGETALHMAVDRRMYAEAELFIQRGADVNAVDMYGNTPLHLAAKVDGNGQLTKLLLDSGGDPNRLPTCAVRPDGKTPLHFAVEHNSTPTIKHLLNAGADVNDIDAEGRTALHFAGIDNSRNVFELLLKNGAKLMSKDNAGLIPGQQVDGSLSKVAADSWWKFIIRSIDNKDTAKLEDMLTEAPQVLALHVKYSLAPTMLHRAIQKRRLDILDYLIDHNADPNIRGLREETPLHYSCHQYTSIDFAKHLIDAGADIEAKEQTGLTPLHLASQENNHGVIQLLIAKGADIDARTNSGVSVMDAVFEKASDRPEFRKTLDLLIKAGHKPTAPYAVATGNMELLKQIKRDQPESLERIYTQNGIRPLHVAVLCRQPRVIEWLFEQGIERNPSTPQSADITHIDTPLMLAMRHNSVDIALLLIKHGADVNHISIYEFYPIQAAIIWHLEPIILESLLNKGADHTLKYDGKTILQLALKSDSKHRERYLELLKAHGITKQK